MAARIAALEAEQQAGQIGEAEYLARARALWEGWLAGGEPEAVVLQEVLAAVGTPEYQHRVSEIWRRWLTRIQAAEGIDQHG